MKNCPQQKIIDAYNRILPELPGVRVWSAASARNLKSRWREDSRRQRLDFWERLFDYIRKSDFLMGNVNDWCADLHWIVKPANFEKIMNRVYHKKRKIHVAYRPVPSHVITPDNIAELR